MSDVKRELPKPFKYELTEEQLQKISGGGCSAEDYADLLANATQLYEGLISLTVYVAERVTGTTQPDP